MQLNHHSLRRARRRGNEARRWLQQPTWWGQAFAVPKICCKPQTALGADVLWDLSFAPVARRLTSAARQKPRHLVINAQQARRG
jgi:hypothetical protein